MRNGMAWAGAAAVGLASWLTLASGAPSLVSPLCLSVALPALFVSELLPGSGAVHDVAVVGLAYGLLPSLFLVWSVPALRRGPDVPSRSLFLFAGLAAASVAWFLATWSDGVRYEGRAHTVGLTLLGSACVLAIGALWLLARRSPSVPRSLCFHAALFAWLAWGAFPWLGELP